MVVGVTGKYCAGKNLVSEILTQKGFRPIDVDLLGHRALEERRSAVIDAFGRGIAGPSGEVDRRKLGEIVFSDKRALARLEAITHPAMVAAVADEIRADAEGNFVINAAILFHMGLHPLCDRVIWVEAPFFVRVRRALHRDDLALLQVVKRMWSQRKLSPQPFQNLVDTYIVRNSGNRDGLETRVLSLVEMG